MPDLSVAICWDGGDPVAMAITIRKIEAGIERSGHYNRQSGLGGYTHAKWGVFSDDKHVATIIRVGSFWEIVDPVTSSGLAQRGFLRRGDAIAWARINLQ